jgi:hypothetical protein
MRTTRVMPHLPSRVLHFWRPRASSSQCDVERTVEQAARTLAKLHALRWLPRIAATLMLTRPTVYGPAESTGNTWRAASLATFSTATRSTAAATAVAAPGREGHYRLETHSRVVGSVALRTGSDCSVLHHARVLQPIEPSSMSPFRRITQREGNDVGALNTSSPAWT